jgi:phage-related protein
MLDIDLPGSDAIQSILIDSRDNLYIGGNFSTTADGNAFTNKVTICTNSGNTKIFPIIEIQGPGVLQSITNYSIGKEIQFDGLTLQAGEIITIQPVSGQVLITSNWGGRGYMQKYVNPGSDIGSFYLKPGTNYISLFMPSDTTAATQAFIYWTPKFWNIEGSRYE